MASLEFTINNGTSYIILTKEVWIKFSQVILDLVPLNSINEAVNESNLCRNACSKYMLIDRFNDIYAKQLYEIHVVLGVTPFSESLVKNPSLLIAGSDFLFKHLLDYLTMFV